MKCIRLAIQQLGSRETQALAHTEGGICSVAVLLSKRSCPPSFAVRRYITIVDSRQVLTRILRGPTRFDASERDLCETHRANMAQLGYRDDPTAKTAQSVFFCSQARCADTSFGTQLVKKGMGSVAQTSKQMQPTLLLTQFVIGDLGFGGREANPPTAREAHYSKETGDSGHILVGFNGPPS